MTGMVVCGQALGLYAPTRHGRASCDLFCQAVGENGPDDLPCVTVLFMMSSWSSYPVNTGIMTCQIAGSAIFFPSGPLWNLRASPDRELQRDIMSAGIFRGIGHHIGTTAGNLPGKKEDRVKVGVETPALCNAVGNQGRNHQCRDHRQERHHGQRRHGMDGVGKQGAQVLDQHFFLSFNFSASSDAVKTRNTGAPQREIIGNYFHDIFIRKSSLLFDHKTNTAPCHIRSGQNTI
ncbi:hypothetical protein NO221_01250 [Gluconacetobacter entanii]|nr:hypothetical protein [Gluconacetobacter entanii]MCW4582434.1 hypothetical protein [Gluconacetobacter entanii]